MSKVLFALVSIFLLCSTAWGQYGGGTYQPPGGGLVSSSITLPATCQVGELYIDTDAGAGGTMYFCSPANTWVSTASAGAGDVLAASANQTWGNAGAITWTFNASAGTDCTISWGDNTSTITCGTVNVAGTLALGANNLTMTGSLGATGARLTKVWTAALESTATPTVNGVALSAIYSPIASPTFTGTVTMPTPFTLGATSVTTTGAKLNYLTNATGTTGTNTTNIVFSASPTFTGSIILPSAAADPAATPGSLVHHSTATNFTGGALRYYNGTVVKQLIDMTKATAEGCTNGYLIAYNSGTDLWECVAPGAIALTNVTFVPSGSDINTFITAASAGDTLMLDAGTYTITASIDVSKQLNIIGQGNAGLYSIAETDVHGTRIYCATDNVTMFNITSSNVRLAHMSLYHAGAGAGIGAVGVTTANNLDGLVFTNLDVVMPSGAGNKTGFSILGSHSLFRDVAFYITSSNSPVVGIYAYNNSSTTIDAIVDVHSTSGTTIGGVTNSIPFWVYNNNDANTITMNLFGAWGRSTNATAADYGAFASSTTTNNAKLNVYQSTLNGGDYDIAQGGTNVATIYGGILVNNTTTGTITYGGVLGIANIPTATTIGGAYIYRVGGTDVPVADGGTGLSAGTQWGLPYFPTTTTMLSTAAGTTGQVLVATTGAAPSWTTYALAGTAAQTYTFPTTSATLARIDAANTFVGASATTSWAMTTQVVTGGLTASGAGANNFSGSSGTFLTSTGAVTIGPGAVGITGIVTHTPPARASGVASYWTINTPADTGITAATESIGVQMVTGTRTWATTGTVALQRERFFAGPTYASANASQTFTDVFNTYMTPPVAGANAIFTRPHTLGILDATSASSSITGGLIVATALGTAATSVGIGGGNINAGGNITGTQMSVVKASAQPQLIFNHTGEASSSSQIYFQDDGVSRYGIIFDMASNGTYDFGIYDYGSTTYRMTISATGAVDFPVSMSSATGTFGAANSLTVGTDSAGGAPAIGSIIFHNATNTNHFTITSGTTGAAIGWTLPIAAPTANGALIQATTAGVLSYLNPVNSSIVGFNAAGALGAYTSISIDNSAAQFYDTAAPTKLVKIDPSQMTAGQTGTIQPIGNYYLRYTLTADTAVTFPVAGTLSPIQKGYTVASAGSMIVGTSSALTEHTAAPNRIMYLAFDGATDEYAYFQWQPPDDWDRGTIKFKAIWGAGGNMDNGQTVIWGLSCHAVSDGDTVDVAAFGGEVTVSDAYADGDETGPLLKVSAASAAVTVQDTPALGDVIMCRVSRDADTDTSILDAWLFAIRIEYGKLSTVAAAW